MSTLNEITVELKRKGLIKDAREIEKVIADSDEYVTIYFDLDVEEDNYEEDEKDPDDIEYVMSLEDKAYKKIEELFKSFVDSISNEGHDTNDNLVCKFGVKKSDLPELQKLIDRRHGGGDDSIYINDYFVAQGFEIVEEPGTSEGIPFEDWAEYIENMESNSESVVSASNEMTMREALKKSNWEAFRNKQNEEWNVTDLLNEFPEADDDKWLDQTRVYLNPDSIVEVDGDDEFFEI